jgi:hypothetical protein
VQLACASALLAVFLRIESRAPKPLVPLGLFRLRNIAVANLSAALWSGAWFSWLFLLTPDLQLVLGYSPLKVGLAFLPANLVMAAFSLHVSAKLVARFAVKVPLVSGLLVSATALLLVAQAPMDADPRVHVLPSILLFGVGAGMACNPLYLAAIAAVGPDQSGLASGLINSSVVIGGALGLGIVAAVAARHTSALLESGMSSAAALGGGGAAGLLLCALFTLVAALISATLLDTKSRQ